MGAIRDAEAKLWNLKQRYSEGTTDHDHDGEMGGSRKGDKTMAKPAKKAAKELLEKGVTKTAKAPAKKKAAPRAPKVEATPEAPEVETPPERTREELQAETSLRAAALGQL